MDRTSNNIGLSQQERHERRERMAAEVANGKSIEQVAREHRVSLQTVRDAVRQFRGAAPAA